MAIIRLRAGPEGVTVQDTSTGTVSVLSHNDPRLRTAGSGSMQSTPRGGAGGIGAAGMAPQDLLSQLLGQSLSALTRIGMPSFPSSPSFTSYETPQGRYVQKGDRIVFEENSGARDTRVQREAIMKRLRGEIGVLTPEREAQINQFGDTYQQQLLSRAQPALEQSLIGRGLGGSNIFAKAVSDLVQEASRDATLQQEGLAKSDDMVKLQALQALEAGQGAQSAAQLEAQGLAQGNIFQNQQLSSSLANSRSTAQLQANMARQQLQQGLLGTLLGHQLGLGQLQLGQQQLSSQERANKKANKGSKFGDILTLGGTIASAPMTGGGSLIGNFFKPGV